MPVIANISDYRAAARARLPRFLFDYIDGGAYGEATLRANVEDFGSVLLRQRVLVDVGRLDTTTRLFGRDWAMPVGIAPVGMTGFFRRRGECQAARAARKAGLPFALSTLATCSVEEVTAAAGPIWYQFYMVKDRGFTQHMLDRAAACGVESLLFTVDLPVPGTRYRDERSGQAGRPSLARSWRRLRAMATRPGWVWDVGLRGRPHTLGNLAPTVGAGVGLDEYWAWVGRNFDPSVTWDDLADLRARWKGPLILKGVLDPADARRAVEAGVDGLVVSNHGGRQLDSTLSTIAALPAIVDAVAGRAAILLDGGVRSGLDVLKARALGADMVLLGRAMAWSVAARGEAGVANMLGLIRAELLAAMAMTGCLSVREAGPHLLAATGAPPGPAPGQGIASPRPRLMSVAE